MKKILKMGYFITIKATCLFGSTQVRGQDDLSWAPWLNERRIIGANNLEPVVSQAATESYDLARVVARLETPDGVGYCSGSRIGENLFLTNYHCQESIECENIVIHMGYEKGLDPNAQGIFQCERILASNETYDYALLVAKWVGTQAEVDRMSKIDSLANKDDQTMVMPSVTPNDFPIAQLFVGELSATTPVIVASHPRGRFKEIDRSDECMILSTEITSISMRETMTHSCHTEGGSNGSPVIAKSHGAILGLHWGGISNKNFMIPMSSIIADLQSQVSASELSQLNIVGEL